MSFTGLAIGTSNSNKWRSPNSSKALRAGSHPSRSQREFAGTRGSARSGLVAHERPPRPSRSSSTPTTTRRPHCAAYSRVQTTPHLAAVVAEVHVHVGWGSIGSIHHVIAAVDFAASAFVDHARSQRLQVCSSFGDVHYPQGRIARAENDLQTCAAP